MKNYTKAYMAGVIDGDGHLGITKHPRFSPAIQFVNESLSMMKWAVLHFGGTFKIEPIPSGKDFYRWILYGKQAQKQFIQDIHPYLLIKKSQAEILLEFLNIDSSDYDPERRRSLFLAIREARALSSVETETRNKLDNKLACAYGAGLIDTDGHIAVRTVKSGSQAGATRTRIELVNIYKPALDALQNQFGGYVIVKKTDPKWTQRYRWVVTDRKNQERFLLAALPYFIAKKEKAKTLLNHVRSSSLKIQPDLMGDHESAPVEILTA